MTGEQRCFPAGQTTQSVTGSNLIADDAGGIVCAVTIGGVDYGSDLFTVRVSGMCACIYLVLWSVTLL